MIQFSFAELAREIRPQYVIRTPLFSFFAPLRNITS